MPSQIDEKIEEIVVEYLSESENYNTPLPTEALKSLFEAECQRRVREAEEKLQAKIEKEIRALPHPMTGTNFEDGRYSGYKDCKDDALRIVNLAIPLFSEPKEQA